MAERLRHLVLVVPGVLGSVLADSGGRCGWGPGLGDLARTMRWPSALSLADHPRLVPVGLLPTIGLIPPFVVPGYDRLVRRIDAAFDDVEVDLAGPGRDRNVHANVVLFPYDFRLGVPAVAERLRAEIGIRLAGLTSRARSRRVIVVAHSMGGLVARYWLGPLGGWRDCKALITVATPHRGVPKALDWLLNGVRVRNVLLRSVTDVLREWPSSYDLLPSYPAVLSQAHPAAAGRPLHLNELDAIAGSGLGVPVHRALQTSAEIADAWLALAGRGDAPEVTAVLSRSHPTPNRAVLVGQRLCVTKTDPEWLPYYGWRGDGTVPAISAIPAELDGDRRRLRDVPDRHYTMASSAVIVDLLRRYTGDEAAMARPADGPADGPTDEPAGEPAAGHAGVHRLDLELDEIAPAGQPATVVASLPGDEAGRGAELWLTVRRPAARAPVFSHRSRLTGRRWQATIPPLAPGMYRVTARASGLPAARRVTCSGVIGMLEA
jgi:Lecithin:cholesterol acyltransferase